MKWLRSQEPPCPWVRLWCLRQTRQAGQAHVVRWIEEQTDDYRAGVTGSIIGDIARMQYVHILPELPSTDTVDYIPNEWSED